MFLLRVREAADEALRVLLLVIEKYEYTASASAAKYLSDAHEITFGRPFEARIYPAPGEEYVRKAIASSAREVQDGKELFTLLCDDLVPFIVRKAGFETMTQKVALSNKRRLRIDRAEGEAMYARIAVGKSCPFCFLLSSKGFVYSSKVSALGANHPGCDCVVVASFEKTPIIEDYHPETMYQMVQVAKISVQSEKGDEHSVGENELRNALAQLYPDVVRGRKYITSDKLNNQRERLSPDGWKFYRSELADRILGCESLEGKRIPPARMPEIPGEWPKDRPSLTQKRWTHILYGDVRDGNGGGGHLSGYGWAWGGSEFPPSYDDKDVFRLLKKASEGLTEEGKYIREVEGIRVKLAVDDDGIISSFYPV